MFQILGQSAASGDAEETRIVAGMRSFRPLTDRARLGATPDRVRVVKVATAGTFESVLARHGRQAADTTTIAILNDAEPGDEIRAGELLKIVEPGRTR